MLNFQLSMFRLKIWMTLFNDIFCFRWNDISMHLWIYFANHILSMIEIIEVKLHTWQWRLRMLCASINCFHISKDHLIQHIKYMLLLKNKMKLSCIVIQNIWFKTSSRNSTSSRNLTSRRNSMSRRNLTSRRNLISRRNLTSRRNSTSRKNLTSRRNSTSRRNLLLRESLISVWSFMYYDMIWFAN